MKNFRKVLALVLVVATLFSFTAMASAKTYTDADKVSYKMAVDVLSAVGILNGYEDDSFKPTNNISREEMAKMIAVLSNSGTNVSELYASACTFADVAKDHWSASYVAYCAKTGVVAGRSASTFDPKANVTGLETAKMLLVVLGFNAEKQGYVGSDWKVNVLRDVKTMGLLNGFAAGYDIEKNITREEAAQMMLNALCAPCVVGFLSNNVITVTNALVYKEATLKDDQIGKYLKVNSYATLLDAVKAGKWCLYGNVVISDDLLRTTLFPGLAFNGAGDCFGRDGVGFTYTVKGVVVASGSYGAASGKQYTTAVDIETDYAKELATSKYKVVVTINGTEKNFDTNAKAIEYIKDKTGNGVDTLVKTSWDATKGEGVIDVNIIETFVGKVANVDDYTKTFDIKDKDGRNLFTSVKIGEAVKADDVVLYRVCNRETHKKVYGSYGSDAQTWGGIAVNVHDYYVVKAETVKVDYSRHYVDGTHVDECFFKTTDAKTLKYNHNYGDSYLGGTAAQNLNALNPEQGETWDVYTDKYGYVMLLAEPAGPEVKAAYFEEGSLFEAHLGSSYGTPVYKVTADAAVYTGAKVDKVELTEVVIKNDNALETQIENAYKFGKVGKLAAYTVNANGQAEWVADGKHIPAGSVISNKSHVLIDGEIYADADTCFMLRSVDPRTGDYTYSEVVGWRNLPDGVKYVVQSVKGSATPSGALATNAQYLNLDGDLYAEYVFIETLTVKTASEFFVMGTVQYNASWTGVAGLPGVDQYHAYRALVNGVDSLVLTTADELAIGLYSGGVTYKDVVLTEDGNLPLYVATDAVTPFQYYTYLNVYVDSANDVYVEGYLGSAKHVTKGAETVTVYHILPAGKLNEYKGYWIESNKLNSNLKLAADQGWVVTNAAGEVTAIYLYDAPVAP